MSKFSTQFETDTLNTLKGSSVYLALYYVAPADDGTGGTEVSTSSTGYSRQAVSFGAVSASGGGGSQIASSAQVQYTATGDWAGGATAVAAYGYWRVSAGGTSSQYLGGGAVSPTKTMSNTDTLTFPTGSLVVSLDL